MRLVVTNLLHIAQWGVYAPSHVTGPIAPSPAFGLTAPAHMTIQVIIFLNYFRTRYTYLLYAFAPAHMTIQVNTLLIYL